MTPALVLLAHGSRDARWAQPFQAVRERVAAALPGTPVQLAYLEHMTPDLAMAIDAVIAAAASAALVVPLFLGQGSHVREDLPRLVKAQQERYPALAVRLAGAAGEAPGVLDAVAAYCVGEARAACE